MSTTRVALRVVQELILFRTLSKALEQYLRDTHAEFQKEQQVIGKRLRDVDDNVEVLCSQSKHRKLAEEATLIGTVV